jgi:hypothetical protein
VTSTPGDRGIEVEAVLLDIALGEPRENAALLTFTLNLIANGTRRRWMQESGFTDASASLMVDRNPVQQAVSIVRDLVRSRLDSLVWSCERAAEDRRC